MIFAVSECRKGTSPALCRASMQTGIRISCRIIPGTAFPKAPARNRLSENSLPTAAIRANMTIPQTALPASIAAESCRRYSFTRCHRHPRMDTLQRRYYRLLNRGGYGCQDASSPISQAQGMDSSFSWRVIWISGSN